VTFLRSAEHMHNWGPVTMMDAHDAGHADVDDQADETRRGPTELREVLGSQLTWLKTRRGRADRGFRA
jgi:hypothetical protein